jgi:gliding-associated putative ABC transporter substrate-binding component GldG
MNKLFTTTLLIIGILLIVNLLANEFHIRFDLTDGSQYTLSKATRDILDDLEEPVTVNAYFSKNLPPNIVKTRQDFQEMLVEYASIADGQILYEFIDPSEEESLEQEAMSAGIRPVTINVREKDQVKNQRAYMGAIISLGDKQEAIPFIQPGSAMEYALSTSIKKISIDEKPAVGFLQGHGEPELMEMGQLLQQLEVLYNSQSITLTDSTDIPANISTLAIIRPLDSIPQSHFIKLDAFLSRGGRIAIAMNRVKGDLQNAFGSTMNTGLETWLQQKGLNVEGNFVVDARCGQVTMQQQTGFGMLQQRIAFPYLPLISNFANHPVTSGLENVLMEFASTISYTGDSTKRFIPLAFTSEQSNSYAAPQYFDVQRQWTEADLPLSNLVVAAALEGNLSGMINSKLVVISDGDLVVNGSPQQPRNLQEDNVSFVSNSIDWLSDDTGLIALRTKAVTSRPIDELEETTKSILKYTNFLLPLFLVIGYGLVRMQQNKMKRMKRMSENYEEGQ